MSLLHRCLPYLGVSLTYPSRWQVDTGIDEFLELLLNQLTQMYLFPLAKMRAMRSLRAYSQVLYKGTLLVAHEIYLECGPGLGFEVEGLGFVFGFQDVGVGLGMHSLRVYSQVFAVSGSVYGLGFRSWLRAHAASCSYHSSVSPYAAASLSKVYHNKKSCF